MVSPPIQCQKEGLGDGCPSLAFQFDSGSEEVPREVPEGGDGGHRGLLGAVPDRPAVRAGPGEAGRPEGEALRQVRGRHGHQVQAQGHLHGGPSEPPEAVQTVSILQRAKGPDRSLPYVSSPIHDTAAKQAVIYSVHLMLVMDHDRTPIFPFYDTLLTYKI